MDKNEAKQYIHDNSREYATRVWGLDKSRKGWICPICGNGSGTDGDGIRTKDGIHFTCFKGCFTNADVIDVIGQVQGITGYMDKLRAAAVEFGIPLDDGKGGRTATIIHTHNNTTVTSDTQDSSHNTQYTSTATQQSMSNDVTVRKAQTDYTDFFRQAHANIGKTSYHRGLSQATLDRFMIGYVEEWQSPTALKGASKPPKSPRLIIPTSRYSYIARDTRSTLTDSQKRFSKMKEGQVRLFNSRALYEADKPIYIVEGEIDALSIMDVGGIAVGLGSTSNRKALIRMLQQRPPVQPLILSGDNDEAGRQADHEIEVALQEMGIPFYRQNIAGQYKDANEALMADRQAFTATVEKGNQIEQEHDRAELEVLDNECACNAYPVFLQHIEESKSLPCISTGFPSLDTVMDGGLYPGLHIVGAISSLGKTTFCLQIADAVAAQGRDVLVFSLEMSRDELMAKSISRLTYIRNKAQGGKPNLPKTTRGILAGSRYHKYSQQEMELIQDATGDYLEYSPHIFISEGMGDVGVVQVREKVSQFVRLKHSRPIVVIDYIQIMSPVNERASDKQNTDKNVLELKRLSRDFGITVIGISSLNRDNYNEPISMQALKESGSLEYGSDVVIGLQYAGMDYQEGESDTNRRKRIRELIKSQTAASRNGGAQHVQVKILKQRNSPKAEAMLDFIPAFNYFYEPTAPQGKNNETAGGWTVVAGTVKETDIPL